MTRLNYGQFLLSSQVNDTLTYFADHSETYTHDVLNRYLRYDRMTPAFVWDNAMNVCNRAISGVPSWSGFGLPPYPIKPKPLSITSNEDAR